MSERMRRCESIANASIRITAAKRLISCPANWLIGGPLSDAEEDVDENADHREQERGAEELRDAKDAHLGIRRLHEREHDPADRELEDEHWQRQHELERRVRLGNAPRQEEREAEARI